MSIINDQFIIISREFKILFDLILNPECNIIVEEEFNIQYIKTKKELYKLIKIYKYILNFDIQNNYPFFISNIIELDQDKIDNIISIHQFHEYHEEFIKIIYNKINALINYIIFFINHINNFIKYKIKYENYFSLINDIELLLDLCQSLRSSIF